MLEAVLSFAGKLLDGLKYLAGFLYIRRSTLIEADRDALQKKTEVQKKQLDIASRPLPDADDVRQRMRDDEL